MEIMEIENWFDCGKPETLLATNRELLKINAKKISRPGNLIIPPVFIDKSAKVSNSIIGPNVTIGEKAEINNCIISESILEKESYVQNMTLENSLIGAHAVLSGKPNRLNIGDSTEVEF